MPRKTRAAAPPVAGRPPASMRPRPDAAENRVRLVTHSPVVDDASMRPRPDAAENRRARRGDPDPVSASMRPRPDAAENGRGPSIRTIGRRGFNEAAARCRGKRPRQVIKVYEHYQLQ